MVEIDFPGWASILMAVLTVIALTLATIAFYMTMTDSDTEPTPLSVVGEEGGVSVSTADTTMIINYNITTTKDIASEETFTITEIDPATFTSTVPLLEEVYICFIFTSVNSSTLAALYSPAVIALDGDVYKVNLFNSTGSVLPSGTSLQGTIKTPLVKAVTNS